MITAIRLQNPTADSSPVETDSIFSPPFSFIPEPELLPVLLSFPESGFSGFAGFSRFADSHLFQILQLKGYLFLHKNDIVFLAKLIYHSHTNQQIGNLL